MPALAKAGVDSGFPSENATNANMLERFLFSAHVKPLRGTLMAAGVEAQDADKARRFRDAALPHLDDVYTLARYLLRSPADADDAVQECYLRAFRHFDGFRGQATKPSHIKPWLMAILRNVCHAEFVRRSGIAGNVAEMAEDALPLWQEPENSPETAILRQRDAQAVRALVAALPEPFREAIVLRDINDLSYREIAEVVGAPIGTVMSRLGRARSMLREAWLKSEHEPECKERST
jgi:RNA polymerase sigma-70 factor, ECF subfamily